MELVSPIQDKAALVDSVQRNVGIRMPQFELLQQVEVAS